MVEWTGEIKVGHRLGAAMDGSETDTRTGGSRV